METIASIIKLRMLFILNFVIDGRYHFHIDEINKGISACLSDEYVSGQKINDEIYSALGLKRNINNKVRDLWTAKKTGTLEGFME